MSRLRVTAALTLTVAEIWSLVAMSVPVATATLDDTRLVPDG